MLVEYELLKKNELALFTALGNVLKKMDKENNKSIADVVVHIDKLIHNQIAMAFLRYADGMRSK